MSEPRFTKEGVKIWVAPKIQGIGDGVKQHEITVVLLADHQSQIATLTQADHDKTAIIRSMELEAEGLRERVKRLEEGLVSIRDAEGESCQRCEGNGYLWADGKAHPPSPVGLCVACPKCGGEGRVFDDSQEIARAALSAERNKG